MTAAKRLWLIPLLALLTGPLWWPAAADFLKPRGWLDGPAQPGPVQEVQKITLTGALLKQEKKGRENLRIKAGKIFTLKREDCLEIEDIDAVLTADDGKKLYINSREGVYDTGKQILILIEDVRVSDGGEFEMHTPALRYLVKFHKLKTAEEVRLTGRGIEIGGRGMFYDIQTGFLRIGGRVSFQLR